MTEIRRKLIEHDLPLVEISEQSAREKNIRHGHPSTLHIWWARRPLAVSRATAFAALMDDPGDEGSREELYDLIKEITPWDAVKGGNSPEVERARALIKEQYPDGPPKVLDPFAGGGSLPLEALRLGCESYASDYNPVAVFIEKATLEWPQKYGIELELSELESARGNEGLFGKNKRVNLLAHMVEKWANIILEQVREEIGRFYPPQTSESTVGKGEPQEQEGWIPVGYIWARTIPCQNPSCGAEIPLIRQFWLSRKKAKHITYRPIVDQAAGTVDFELLVNDGIKEAGFFDPSDGTVSRANASCLVCGQVTKAARVRQLARDGAMGERMIAVVLHHPDETGKRYRLATEEDERTFQEAEKHLKEKIEEWPYLESPLPEEELPPVGTLGFRVNRYGMTQWKDLFNSRQQLAMMTFVEKIRGSHEAIQPDAKDVVQTHHLGSSAVWKCSAWHGA